MNLHEFPRHHLTFGPSPVHPLRRLTQHLGGAEQAIEIICNGLAARVLVPDDVLDKLLKDAKIGRQRATQLAGYFSGSREVIYRKFRDRGLIVSPFHSKVEPSSRSTSLPSTIANQRNSPSAAGCAFWSSSHGPQ